jgi:hypothetical protein
VSSRWQHVAPNKEFGRMSTPAFAERRTALRLPHGIPLQIVDSPSSITLVGTIVDLSMTGMRIFCNEYLPPCTRFRFVMLDAPYLTIDGEVRWTKAAQAAWQAGVLFLHVDDAKERLIDQVINPELHVRRDAYVRNANALLALHAS